MRTFAVLAVSALAAIWVDQGEAAAKQCGNDAGGFSAWIRDFQGEALARGVNQQTLSSAFSNVSYATKTIWADRNQKSFKLSFEQFMQKRGADYIISKGRQLKQQNARLLSGIESRYGVPAGPLLAIWGMETGFGRFSGDTDIFSPLATLAYDCRRPEFFEEHLYGALRILQTGQMSRGKMIGALHGELGQMQFLPANYVKYGADGDGDGRVDMVTSHSDALASTANYLKAHGWRRGAGYQPGQPNFPAIQEWNAAGVYQKAIAVIGQAIDG